MIHLLEMLASVVFSLCGVFEFTLHMACQEKNTGKEKVFGKYEEHLHSEAVSLSVLFQRSSCIQEVARTVAEMSLT